MKLDGIITDNMSFFVFGNGNDVCILPICRNLAQSNGFIK